MELEPTIDGTLAKKSPQESVTLSTCPRDFAVMTLTLTTGAGGKCPRPPTHLFDFHRVRVNGTVVCRRWLFLFVLVLLSANSFC